MGVTTSSEWRIEVVDRGPDWLFVRLHPREGVLAHDIADRLWEVLNNHFVYRVVVEMNEVAHISSHLMGQLVMLQKRVLQHDGALRLCGMPPACSDALRICRLHSVLPNYANHEDAVLGRTS